MSANPVFIAVPKIWMGQLTAANTNRDGTGTLATIVTAPAGGIRVDAIDVEAIVTTTAGMVRFFISDGAVTRLWREMPVSAVVPSATVAAFRDALAMFGGLVLPSGWSLKAATEKAETFNIFARGGEL